MYIFGFFDKHCLWLLSLLIGISACAPAAPNSEITTGTSPFHLTNPQRFSASLLGGVVAEGILQEVWFFQGGLEPNTHFMSASAGYTFGELTLDQSVTLFDDMLLPDRRLVTWEVEGLIAKHWGVQTHVEFVPFVIARWHPFIWDKWLDTSIAIGEGVSFASSVPVIEAQRWSKTNAILNYMMYEMTFAPTMLQIPEVLKWEMVMRIHHRSGVYGLFNEVSGASNVIAFGLRVTF